MAERPRVGNFDEQNWGISVSAVTRAVSLDSRQLVALAFEGPCAPPPRMECQRPRLTDCLEKRPTLTGSHSLPSSLDAMSKAALCRRWGEPLVANG